MGYRKLTAHPRLYAQEEGSAEGSIEIFKKRLRQSGRDRQHARDQAQQNRNLVPRRSAYRAKEQDYPPPGQARHKTNGAA